MLANPPEGKSWKVDSKAILEGKKQKIKDPLFLITDHPTLKPDEQLKLIPRGRDGQLLLLVNKLSKMKQNTPLVSPIAIVHNGSALFTSDVGSGENNIRRTMIENDWL
jgi:type I restriction enzyme M protein